MSRIEDRKQQEVEMQRWRVVGTADHLHEVQENENSTGVPRSSRRCMTYRRKRKESLQ